MNLTSCIQCLSYCFLGAVILDSCDQNDDQNFVTTGTLFQEMIDLEALSKVPDPIYRNIQFSSYDRRSKKPGEPGWFANSDGFGGEPEPGFQAILAEPDEDGIGEYLMVNVEGPGAVVRLWTAAISGSLKIFLDNDQNPAYDGEAEAFFRRTYDVLGIQLEDLDGTVYQRDASYAPIPFSKRFRMVWRGNIEDIHFYHVQIRLYEPGTRIKSFRPSDIEEYASIIREVTEVLKNSQSANRPETVGVGTQKIIAKGTTEIIHKLKGPAVIQEWSMNLVAGNLQDALRQTVVEWRFDGAAWGQVHAPAGDLFGAAPGLNPYHSLPFSVAEDGTMTSRFVMPFRDSAVLIIKNFGNQEIQIINTVKTYEKPWDDRSMHFRARWRVDHNLNASNTDIQDLPFLIARGHGTYVGSVSFVFNPNSIPTSWGNWWGEGDEKIFIDQDEEPSIFGTGSEDYYNYSWSSPDIFYFPYCGQPRNDGPGNRGFVTNYRWHVLDAIPFRENLEFYMELFSHEPTPGLSYARIGYHYARPGIRDDFVPIKRSDLVLPDYPENWQPESRFGARNSIFYQAEDILINKEDTHMNTDPFWSGGKILVWTPAALNGRLEFQWDETNPGTKRIYITAALMPESGSIRVFLDGQPGSFSSNHDTIHLNERSRTILRNFALEPVNIHPGRHSLEVVFVGPESGEQKIKIALDFIWIQDVN